MRNRTNWHDDDSCYDGQSIDGEAFANTLLHLGTSQIDAILDCLAALPANVGDHALVSLLEAMLKPFEEFLSLEQMEELWNCAYWTNYELRKGREPALTYKQSEEQFQDCRRRLRGIVPESKKPGKAKKKRRPEEP
jgi:hypothetical protein